MSALVVRQFLNRKLGIVASTVDMGILLVLQYKQINHAVGNEFAIPALVNVVLNEITFQCELVIRRS